MSSNRKHTEELRVYCWSNQIRGTRLKQPTNGFKQIGAHKFLELVMLILEALNDPRYADRPLLHDLLVAAGQHVQQNGHDINDDWKRFLRNVLAAIRSRYNRCSLGASSKEVEIFQTRFETTFTYNDRWKLCRDFFQSLGLG